MWFCRLSRRDREDRRQGRRRRLGAGCVQSSSQALFRAAPHWGPSRIVKIEKYNIGFVPLAERYGSEKRLFTIWFSINLSIVCLTVGTLGILAGLGLPQTILALVLGNAIGTVFMAAHSAQGPHLGIPQMIQSRAQFGVFGAAIPLVAVIITYTLYLSADEVVIRRAITSLIPVGTDA